MNRKLKDNRGETLVEMLASILIAALSVAVLFTCCMASVEMGRETHAADQRYYEGLSAAEGRTGSSEEGKVTIEGTGGKTDAAIQLYGGEEMYSYQWKRGAAPGGP